MSRTATSEFSAEIKKAGINPYVDIPDEISRFFGKRAYVPIKGFLNETPIVGTLVPLGGGRRRLYINLDMRKRSGARVGDTISLRIKLDTEARQITPPTALKEALEANGEAKSAWARMTPSHQREILAYLNSLKTTAALERNVEKAIKLLLENG